MKKVLTKKKKYVAPSVQVLELETTQILAGSGETNSTPTVNGFTRILLETTQILAGSGETNSTPTVNGFQPGDSFGSGDMEESSPARRTSIWD